MIADLRQFIARAQEIGEYKVVEGADWNLELGAITVWQAELGNSPVLLFDKIKDIQRGIV